MDVQTKAMIEKLEARITQLENKFQNLTENDLSNVLEKMMQNDAAVEANFQVVAHRLNELGVGKVEFK